VRENKYGVQILQNYELNILFLPNIIVAINSMRIKLAGYVACVV
jgi:hypothetical protein